MVIFKGLEQRKTENGLLWEVNNFMNIEIGIKFDSKKESVIRKNKGQSLLAFPDNYTVFGIETTELDSKYDEIIEIK